MKILTQLERDLQSYTYNKLCLLITDVMQAFSIADQRPSAGLSCLGASLLKTAAQIAITLGAPKKEFLKYCAEIYDQLKEADETERASNQDERSD